MPARNFNIGVLTIGLIGLTGMLPLSAELPSLGDGDDLGYFVVARSKSSAFGITSQGKATIKVLDIKGAAVNNNLTVGIDFNVTETTPDGKKVTRKLNPESLETKNPATNKPKNVVFTGKVTGDIEFEATVSEERGMILLGGRLLNAAALKNPTQFSIEVDIPSTIPKAKADANKKETKELEDQIKRDKVQITWTDGKKAKFPANSPVDGASKEVSGPGITAATLDFSEFKDRQIQLNASPNSSMVLSNKANQRLSEGFSLIWTADAAKDPDGKARLAIAIR
jgi:hypothetical protein